jgi:protein-ribulosamine 3-kinase
MIPPPVAGFVAAQGWGAVTRAEPVGGGCINDGRALTTSLGPRLFLKSHRGAPPAMFALEAEGLRALGAVDGAPRVPAPLLWDEDFLLTEHIDSARSAPDYAAVFGERLARLHAHTAPEFGFDHDNYLGLTPQPNPHLEDGWAFFAEHRLGHQGRLARDAGRLGPASLRRLERLAGRLRELVPPQPASLVHGDLWSGNHLPGPDGQACLIDPAAHYGWAEADLAMTTLFGRLPEAFYAAYDAARPLRPGWRDRLELYNLYHLLNHLNLFGAGYLGSVEAVLARYS